MINRVVTFNNSSKLILKNYDEYFLIKIITETIETAMSGLKLVKPTISNRRQAWLINGTLYNSEVWHNVVDSDIAHFADLDKYLHCGLVKAHANVPLEHLYLETASVPIQYIISAR